MVDSRLSIASCRAILVVEPRVSIWDQWLAMEATGYAWDGMSGWVLFTYETTVMGRWGGVFAMGGCYFYGRRSRL